MTGDTGFVCHLIGCGSDVNAQDHEGWTPLMWAAQAGNEEFVEILLKAGACVYLQNGQGSFALEVAHSCEQLVCVELLHEAVVASLWELEQWKLAALLMHALLKRSIALVRALIKVGAHLLPQPKGVPILRVPVADGHLLCVRELIQAGCEVNAQYHGITHLIAAATANQPEILKELLDAGAEVDTQTANGRTALMFAAQGGFPKCTKELIRAGCDVNKRDRDGDTALRFAAGSCLECVKCLVNAGADVKIPGKDRVVPLMAAAGANRVDIVKELLRAGADIHAQDENGRTALMFACVKGHTECVTELICAGADVNKADKKGNKSALIYTVEQGDYVDCVQQLIDAQADVDHTDTQGSTALMICAEENRIESMKRLISAGCDMNKREKYGWSPLMVSQNQGHFELMKCLIRAGADVNLTIKGGHLATGETTPLMFACAAGHISIFQELLEAGADVNMTNSVGSSALMFAVQSLSAKIVQLLIDKGADVNASDNSGKTALYEAAQEGHLEARSNGDYSEKEASLQRNKITGYRSESCKILLMLLKAGAHVKCRHNLKDLCKLHVGEKPTNPHILNMLFAAGGDVPDAECAKFDRENQTLLELCRHSVRKALKKTHPEQNFYQSVYQLDLPHEVQSFLLYHAGHDEKFDNFQTKNKTEALFSAVFNGELDELKALVESGIDINARNKTTGDTALILATKGQHIECVRYLLRESGAYRSSRGPVQTRHSGNDFEPNINLRNSMGQTALMAVALYPGGEEVMKLLIEAGADVNLPDLKGATAIFVEVFLNRGDIFDELLRHGADVNIQDRRGDTPLINAVRKKNQTAVHKLLKAGANVNQQNNVGAGDTALHHCVTHHLQHGLVELLVGGTDPNISTKDGVTPLMIASFEGFTQFVCGLVLAGADVNKQANNGKTAMILAAVKGHADCVKLLIQAGAGLDATDEDGASAILTASQKDNQKCLSLLLNAGAKVPFDSMETIVHQLVEKIRSGEEDAQSLSKFAIQKMLKSFLEAGVIPDSAETTLQKQILEGESCISGPKEQLTSFGHKIFS